MMNLGKVDNNDIPAEAEMLLLDTLGHDGVFIMRLIEINHGSTILTQIVAHLHAALKSQPTNGDPPSLIPDSLTLTNDPTAVRIVGIRNSF